MQPTQLQRIPSPIPAAALMPASLSPAAMAALLRRAGGDAARCFAQTMQADAAWANESWGDYWADVAREV